MLILSNVIAPGLLNAGNPCLAVSSEFHVAQSYTLGMVVFLLINLVKKALITIP